MSSNNSYTNAFTSTHDVVICRCRCVSVNSSVFVLVSVQCFETGNQVFEDVIVRTGLFSSQ